MTAPVWIAFLVAAALGAPARYLLDSVVQRATSAEYPWGTGVVNISGSFALGLLSGLALYHAFPSDATLVLGTGFCGAYTTFSTFAFETVRLIEGTGRGGGSEGRGGGSEGRGGGGEGRRGGRRARGAAIRNVVVNTGGGLLAAGAGLALASL